jgi:hypothetical protein
MSTRVPKTIFKPEINFKIELLSDEEQATIVHCTVLSDTLIRIWKSTCLVQQDGAKKKLLQAYNIPEYPVWKSVEPGHVFTLVFEALDKSCTVFNLEEQIPEPGGFIVKRIKRNAIDVYELFI